MKSLIFKNPVTSSIIINIIGLIIIIYAIGKGIYGITLLAIPIAVLNRCIIDYGININNKKKLMIYFSVFVMIITTVYFTLLTHNAVL